MTASLPKSFAVLPIVENTLRFNNLDFAEITYTAHSQMPMHTHEQAFLDLCLTGVIRDVWNTRSFSRGTATLNYIPPGAPHGNQFQEECRCFQIILSASWLERLQGSPQFDRAQCFREGHPIWIATRLHREFQMRDNVTPLILEGLVLELLGEMSRNAGTQQSSTCPRWLKQSRDYLQAHFTESIVLDVLAETVGVHPSHLMRAFRQRYHCSIGEYIRTLRIEFACHLISTTSIPLSQIAHEVGFSDQSHFNRTFKNHMKMTPSDFVKISGRASSRQPMIF